MAKREILVKVPRKFKDKKFRDSIGIGLFSLVRGYRPDCDKFSEKDLITVKLQLSEKAATMWDYLLPKFDNNQSAVARQALCLVYNKPKHCLACKI